MKLASNALGWSGLGRALRHFGAWQGLLVLNYHRIGDPAATPCDRDLFSATPDAFTAQLAFLKQHYDVIAPADIPAVVDSKRGRHILLTFDDGYRDNRDLALPALTASGLKATFFICTGYIDRPRLPWWDEIAWTIRTSPATSLPPSEWFPAGLAFTGPDRTEAIRAVLAHYKTLPPEKTAAFLDAIRAGTDRDGRTVDGRELWMSWEMVRELHRAGMTVGAHTMNHQLLARLTSEEQAREIAGSRDRITREIGEVPTAFAYPVGGRTAFTDETKRLLAEQGFRFGFSFYGGMQPFDTYDAYDIRRAHIGYTGTQLTFEAATTLPQLFARW